MLGFSKTYLLSMSLILNWSLSWENPDNCCFRVLCWSLGFYVNFFPIDYFLSLMIFVGLWFNLHTLTTLCPGNFLVWFICCIDSYRPEQLPLFYKPGLQSEIWIESARQVPQDGVTDPGLHISSALCVWWDIECCRIS